MAGVVLTVVLTLVRIRSFYYFSKETETNPQLYILLVDFKYLPITISYFKLSIF